LGAGPASASVTFSQAKGVSMCSCPTGHGPVDSPRRFNLHCALDLRRLPNPACNSGSMLIAKVIVRELFGIDLCVRLQMIVRPQTVADTGSPSFRALAHRHRLIS